MEGRVLRRSVTLADQLAAVGPAGTAAATAAAGSCNLRDLLKLRDEDDLAAGRRAAVTLASAMAAERLTVAPASSAAAAASPARTLLDIIRDDQLRSSSGAVGEGGDPLVRRAVSLPAPVTATPPPPPPPPETPPRQLPSVSPPTVGEEEEEEQGERVSLMALLEQTERQWSAGSGATVQQHLASPSAAASASVSAAAEDEAEAEAGKGAAGGGCCCVCMARAKGAAFIPCGHTFCRTCARELLAGRGRCPLCNAAILDVLDIF
ncbi:hypothetical protein OsI_29976 [Oryza sativa Indica Group]|uniref:RING-type domain-containing protein n=1 Tax=Oryza sativa subsp. indica TaxID=39946 RepID=A2YXB0_ORYSI|nr:hypothetical protein OsI_29976 [Oryza sativa Indica Group]